jgi:hypothetical protein
VTRGVVVVGDRGERGGGRNGDDAAGGVEPDLDLAAERVDDGERIACGVALDRQAVAVAVGDGDQAGEEAGEAPELEPGAVVVDQRPLVGEAGVEAPREARLGLAEDPVRAVELETRAGRVVEDGVNVDGAAGVGAGAGA